MLDVYAPLVALSEGDIKSYWRNDSKVIISVICITYNHKEFILDTINGVLAQKSPYPFELIIRDDASNDGTTELLRQFEIEYPSIVKLYVEKVNQYKNGVRPLSAVLPKAKGKLIALCEGDDYWLDPEKLRKQADIMLTDEACSLTYHAAVIIDAESSELIHTIDSGKDYSSRELVQTPPGIMTATKMFINPYYYGLSERDIIYGDYPLNAMLATMGHAKFVKNIRPSVYRKHTGGVWSSLSKQEQKISGLIAASKILTYTLSRNEREFSQLRAEKLVAILLRVMPMAVAKGIVVGTWQFIKNAISNHGMRVVKFLLGRPGKKAKNSIVNAWSEFNQRRKVSGKTKYFCIGRNKTGTTSIKKAFKDLGFIVGSQHEAEILTDKYYLISDFAPIIRYCKRSQVFQDAPFSYAETYKYMDRAFPGSKFILTVRNDAEEWYNSITRFHAKAFGGGEIPTAAVLKEATYVRKGYMYDVVKLHNTPDDDIYNKEIMISHYNNYNREIIEYFKNRPGDLLVINLSEEGAYQKFINFLGVDSPYQEFPWENKT